MSWDHKLTDTQTEGEVFQPGAPFTVRREDNFTIIIKVQSRRLGQTEWSPGQILPLDEMIPCFGCRDTEYRLVAESAGVHVFINQVIVSQADRKAT